MNTTDEILKKARECHTKAAWEELFKTHRDQIASTNNSKFLHDLFKLISADTQCFQYNPDIFASILEGCFSCWDIKLGTDVSEFCKKLSSPKISLAAAKLHLEAGQVLTARELATKGLRLSSTNAYEQLQLEMLICSCYAEEGKNTKAVKLLSQLGEKLSSLDLSANVRGEVLMQMGRMRYFLGRYAEASEIFREAAQVFLKLRDWDNAARALFNTAACFHNSGGFDPEKTSAIIEEVRMIAESHNLPGPLAHCEAFYGTIAYQHGHFASAKEHYRAALNFLNSTSKSSRKLHILSMLAKTYLRMGRYHLAKKFAQQTIDLAIYDETDRYKCRYKTLHAEILWEDGEVENSIALMQENIAQLESKSAYTLEEAEAILVHENQNIALGAKTPSNKLNIDKGVLKHTDIRLNDELVAAGFLLNSNQYQEAEKLFKSTLSESQSSGYRLQEARALLGLIESKLKQRKFESAQRLSRDFEIRAARLGESPLKTKVQIIRAATCYQKGDFSECERFLRLAAKTSRSSFSDTFVLNACLATIDGKSARISAGWQQDLLSRFARTYFAPSLEAVGDRSFVVSQHYSVGLDRHPALAELLHYLLMKPNYSATPEEIQREVWNQSLHSQGWKQKIRNTIMRVREFFPYTIAPLVVHTDKIYLNSDAISIQPLRREGLDTDSEVIRLIGDTPMSSSQLSRRLKISPATTKRILKRLCETDNIASYKEGRNVYYTSYNFQESV